MIYTTNETREKERAIIREMYAKISHMPLNAFPEGLKDVQTLHRLLDSLDFQLVKEIREEKKRQGIPCIDQ